MAGEHDDDLDPADEIERALDACGQTDVPGFCWHAGTEYCSFHCLLRGSLKMASEAGTRE